MPLRCHASKWRPPPEPSECMWNWKALARQMSQPGTFICFTSLPASALPTSLNYCNWCNHTIHEAGALMSQDLVNRDGELDNDLADHYNNATVTLGLCQWRGDRTMLPPWLGLGGFLPWAFGSRSSKQWPIGKKVAPLHALRLHEAPNSWAQKGSKTHKVQNHPIQPHTWAKAWKGSR